MEKNNYIKSNPSFLLKLQYKTKILFCYKKPENYLDLTFIFKERFKKENLDEHYLAFEDGSNDYIFIENDIDLLKAFELFENNDKINKKIILISKENIKEKDLISDDEFINKSVIFNYLNYSNKLIKNSKQDYNQLIKKQNKPCKYCFTYNRKTKCKYCSNRRYIPITNKDKIVWSMIENKIRQLLIKPIENLVNNANTNNINKIYEFNKIKKIEIKKEKLKNNFDLDIDKYSQISYSESENEIKNYSKKNVENSESLESQDMDNIKNINKTLKKFTYLFEELYNQKKNIDSGNNSQIKKLKDSPLELIKEVKNDKNMIRSEFGYKKNTIYTKKELLFKPFKLKNFELKYKEDEILTLRFKVKNINDFDWPEDIELKGTQNCPFLNSISNKIIPLKTYESQYYSIDIFYENNSPENFFELIFYGFNENKKIKYFSKKIKIQFNKLIDQNKFEIYNVEVY